MNMLVDNMNKYLMVDCLKKNGWVDKYLVKRNSYQLLSAPVSIWLARTWREKNKTFHFISHSPIFPTTCMYRHHPYTPLKLDHHHYHHHHHHHPALRWSVSCEAVSFMHEEAARPWSSHLFSQFRLFVNPLERHPAAEKGGATFFSCWKYWNCQYWTYLQRQMRSEMIGWSKSF